VNEGLPVTLYWALLDAKGFMVLYPYEREREARIHAEEEQLTCVPAALQGWLTIPVRL
jgi:hypothetical protein